MTDPVLITLISTIGGICLALLTLFGTVIMFKLNTAADERKAAAAEREETAKVIGGKLETIHTLTNSNLAKVNERLDKALAQNEDLTAQVKTLNEAMATMQKAAPTVGAC